MDSVSWEQAMEFCRRLTDEDRIHNRIGAKWFYRLPTKAEWEYACRAGRTGIDSGEFPLDWQAWSKINSNGRTARVARKKPSP